MNRHLPKSSSQFVTGPFLYLLQGGANKEKLRSPCYQIREGDQVNIDVTSPGATLALGLMFFQTANRLDKCRISAVFIEAIGRSWGFFNTVVCIKETLKSQINGMNNLSAVMLEQVCLMNGISVNHNRGKLCDKMACFAPQPVKVPEHNVPCLRLCAVFARWRQNAKWKICACVCLLQGCVPVADSPWYPDSVGLCQAWLPSSEGKLCIL